MRNSIKVERARLNVTQAALAEHVKVARQTIIAIEAGSFNPTTKVVFKIAKFRNCKPDEIFEL